jgi:lipopolysaccharide export system permease protein
MILHRYFARRFLLSFGAVLGIFATLLVLIDLIEQARRFGGQAQGFGDLAALALLNAPQGVYRILPLIMVIATVVLFLSLARSSELVVTRAAGRSALRALVAPVTGALAIGAVAVALLNPIVAATAREYEARVATLSGAVPAQAVAGDGVWLRQGSEEGHAVIRAERANLDGTELTQVTILAFGPDLAPVLRIEAAQARLLPGVWELTEAQVWPLGAAVPGAAVERHHRFDLPTTLTADQIRDSFGTPGSIPIWDLPAFIADLKQSGFAARRHEVWMQMELALPAMLTAVVLIGAAFTMRHARAGRTGIMVLSAILISFGLYFLRNFAQVLAEAGDLPPVLAAWAPPVAAILLALGLILHLEDG